MLTLRQARSLADGAACVFQRATRNVPTASAVLALGDYSNVGQSIEEGIVLQNSFLIPVSSHLHRIRQTWMMLVKSACKCACDAHPYVSRYIARLAAAAIETSKQRLHLPKIQAFDDPPFQVAQTCRSNSTRRQRPHWRYAGVPLLQQHMLYFSRHRRRRWRRRQRRRRRHHRRRHMPQWRRDWGLRRLRRRPRRGPPVRQRRLRRKGH